MMRRIALLLWFTSLPTYADTLLWDWSGNQSTITHFSLLSDGRPVVDFPGADTRSAPLDLSSFRAGATLTLRACGPTACSAPSDPLVIPAAPGSVRVTITFESSTQ